MKAMNRIQYLAALKKSLRYKSGVSRQIVTLQIKQLTNELNAISENNKNKIKEAYKV